MNQQGGQGGPPLGQGQHVQPPHVGHGQVPHPGYPPHVGQGQHPHPGAPAQPIAPHPGQAPAAYPPQPGGHPHYAYPAAFVRAQYEFSPRENKIISDLAVWSGGLGIVKLVHGALSLVVANIFGLLLHLAVGLLMLQANRSLRKVVSTEGNDIDHLLKSVEQLATVFQIRLILTLVVSILVGIGVVVALSV